MSGQSWAVLLGTTWTYHGPFTRRDADEFAAATGNPATNVVVPVLPPAWRSRRMTRRAKAAVVAAYDRERDAHLAQEIADAILAATPQVTCCDDDTCPSRIRSDQAREHAAIALQLGGADA